VYETFREKISFLASAEQMLSIAEIKVYMQRKPQWLRMPVSSNLKKLILDWLQPCLNLFLIIPQVVQINV